MVLMISVNNACKMSWFSGFVRDEQKALDRVNVCGAEGVKKEKKERTQGDQEEGKEKNKKGDGLSFFLGTAWLSLKTDQGEALFVIFGGQVV